jgi:hypothetical protein
MEDEAEATRRYSRKKAARKERGLPTDQFQKSRRSEKDLGTSGETAAVNRRIAQEQNEALDIEEALRPEPTDREYDPRGTVSKRVSTSRRSKPTRNAKRVISVEQQLKNLSNNEGRDIDDRTLGKRGSERKSNKIRLWTGQD